jgi:MoaA/NifB/PqqE/SkfB family radical SAM enzyme
MLRLKHRDTIDFAKKDLGSLAYIGVYTSQRCNLACKYCFEDSAKPAAHETSLAEKLCVISQAKKLGAEALLVTGAGEPLVDDNLFLMIEYAYKSGMGTLLYTNGLEGRCIKDARPISQDKARFLFDYDVTAIVKLESLNPESHDYLTGVKGSHEKAMESLRRLQEAGYKNVEGDITRLGVAALYTRPNLKELPELKKWCENKGIKLVVDVVGVHGRAQRFTDMIPTKEEILVVQKFMGRESGIVASGECIFWKYGLIIDHEGDARYCTEIDTDDIGNIREHSVEELLAIKNKKYPAKAGCFSCPLKSEHYLGYDEMQSLGRLQ